MHLKISFTGRSDKSEVKASKFQHETAIKKTNLRGEGWDKKLINLVNSKMSVRVRREHSRPDLKSWCVQIDEMMLRSVQSTINHLVNDVQRGFSERFRHEQVDVAETEERRYNEQEHETHAAEDTEKWNRSEIRERDEKIVNSETSRENCTAMTLTDKFWRHKP